MKILIALTSFKGTIPAAAACHTVAASLKTFTKDVDTLAISDGGDGLLESISACYPTTTVNLEVTGALGEKISSKYLLWKKPGDKTAFIEVAQICGLAQIAPHRRNPMITTTYGVGEMIAHVLRRRVKTIYIGLGGSATQDGGAGMAQALGAKLLDTGKKSIGFGCGWLQALSNINIHRLEPRLKRARIIALSDVTNPLLGEQGTARVYAPQKGADAQQVKIIENALANFAGVVEKDLKKDIRDFPGAGAAGGLGAGLAAFTNAKIVPGALTLLELLNAKEKIAQADIVIVGEGKLDAQSLYGKATQAVSALAHSMNKKVYGIFGQIDSGNASLTKKLNLTSWVSLSDVAGSPEKAMAYPAEALTQATLKLFQKKEARHPVTC